MGIKAHSAAGFIRDAPTGGARLISELSLPRFAQQQGCGCIL